MVNFGLTFDGKNYKNCTIINGFPDTTSKRLILRN